MVLFPIVALLGGVLLELILARVLTPRVKGWLAFASSLVALGGVLIAMASGGPFDGTFMAWDGPAQFAYQVDGLSLLFALMATGIGAAVLLYSIAYMEEDGAATRFYALMLVFIAGLVQLVYSADLILMYFSWELIGLCSFFLVGFWYGQSDAARGARKVLVMTHLAGYGLLAAVLILFASTGTTLWTDPKMAAAFTTPLFLLMLLAAVAKSVQFPLHTWIPDAMAAPTPVSALLHAACYVKAGVYLIARMHSFAPWAIEWQTLVVWIGTVTMLVGVLYALVQSDLKRLLAFHTVSQIGYMVLGLGLSTPLGIAAGLLHCLNHAFFKSGLFLGAGAVQRATGTRDMDRMGGLARGMPTTTTLWLISAGSIAGVPLLSGFVSKWLLYNAALEAGQVIPALVAWIVSILTVFSFLKATSGVFLGEARTDKPLPEAPSAMLIAPAILAAASVLLGIAPQLAIEYVINPLLPALGTTRVIGVSWFGLTVAGGSWMATGGLILAAIAVTAGAIAYWLAQPTRRMATATVSAGGVFTGGEPLSSPTRLPASDFSLMVKEGLAPFYHWVDVDRYYLALWRLLLHAMELLSEASRWLEQRALVALPLFALLVGLIALAMAGDHSPVTPAETLSAQSSNVLISATGVAFLALLLAGIGLSRSRIAELAAAGLLSLFGLAAEQPLVRLVALEGAALVALVCVWQMSGSRRAARVYLAAVLLSLVATVVGTLAMDVLSPPIVIALLFTGFALKFALVPLYLWLPMIAEKTPAPVIGMIIAVVDLAGFGELLIWQQFVPWLFAPTLLWIAFAVLSALFGAALMLAQRDLKRLLAFSTLQDMGLLLVGVALGGTWGTSGAMLGAAMHALAKALLFASVSQVETGEVRGMAIRRPIAGLGFVVGALATLGIPPTMGFAAHWRLFTAAASASPWLLTMLLVASGLALLAYARVIALYWWGPGEARQEREPISLAIAIVGLSILLLLLGWVPWLWTGS